MSVGGRGRGYLGRHHLREDAVRPGDAGIDKAPHDADKHLNSADKPPPPGERAAHVGDQPVRTSTPRAIDKGREKSTRTSDQPTLNKTYHPGDKNSSRDMTTHAGDKATRVGDTSTSAEKANALGEEGQCSKPPDIRRNSNIAVSDSNSRVGGDGGEEAPLGADDEAALAELLRVQEPHRPLVAMLEQFSPGDDGIAFNRKLRELEATLTGLCSDDTQLQLAFESLRGAALGSASLTRKLASVGASFTRQQRQSVLRMALLNVMQTTFAKLDVLERASPHILTNAATLMGDYFMEARLGNGSKVQLLCSPLLQYLRALLTCTDRRAHRALATQLMQNGRELLTSNAQELDELSVSIRIRLLSAPPASLIWLLLSADLCINKFLPLPASLQAFYASNLDLVQETDAPDYSEVSYGSWRKPEDDEDASQANLSEDGSGRKLRPILGAGAALTRHNDSFAEASAARDTQDAWNKSGLAKRYDLNTWRQRANEDLDDGRDEFVPTQQFGPNESQWGGAVAQYSNLNRGAAPFAVATSAPPPPYPAPADGKFATPPPYVPERTVVAAVPDDKFSAPPPPFLAERTVVAAVPNEDFSAPPPFVPERSVVATVAGDKFAAPPPSFAPERFDKQNFPSGERARRPPENWRKEREESQRRVEWTRQRSRECEELVENGGEAECRVGGGDARPARAARRDGRGPRARRDDAEDKAGAAVAPPPPPPAAAAASPHARRAEKRMEVPRSRKYWDHDDRLDKDYNS